MKASSSSHSNVPQSEWISMERSMRGSCDSVMSA
ncbi:Uncharacterised protein [Bordetella pertussis]|nr:Uncharacterised protein [Bordetella pertussis]CFP68479.1 Uncharacterised protein [Bordetella pertussis]